MSASIDDIAHLELTAVYALWRARDAERWSTSDALYAAVARRLLRGGEALLAFDVIAEALTHWPGNEGLLTLEALALARAGASERANGILTQLYRSGTRDEETISLLARTHKDLGLSATGPANRRHHLELAEAFYSEAFAADRLARFWSGINAATLALVSGDMEAAATLANEVRTLCLATLRRLELANPEPVRTDRYWLLATLGEASLILEDFNDASTWYRSAAGAAHGNHGDVASTRRNARLILEAQGLKDTFLDECLPAPRVVVFTGHMLDAAGAPHPRFPEAAEARIAAAIEEYLETVDARIGFASAACGSDIVFLEAMLERGAEINIVLPCDSDSFIQASVARGGARWIERFHTVLSRAKEVIYASQRAAGDVYFVYANILMFGLAKSHARQLEGRLDALSVWDGSGVKTGGAGSAVALWRGCGQRVHVIDPQTLDPRDLPPTPDSLRPSDQWLEDDSATTGGDAPGAPDRERKLVSMLFADAVGFSKLDEDQIPRFVEHFLGPIAALVATFDKPPVVRNTWGDALYFVFNDVGAAGRLALAVCELIAGTRWSDHGLPETFGIRIGLHSGPAYPVTDPIIQQFNYTGVHVSRAARIEPITPPGAVYASQAFAALAEAVGVREFACDYVGRTSLAKHYGEFPTYRVRRT